jgi:hypothetical protein
MSDTQDLQELEVDTSHDRVRSGYWHWKTSSGSHYKSTSPYNNAPLLTDNNKVAGHLRVVLKPDAIGNLFNHYYLQPSSSMPGTAQQIAVTAVKHDSQGTIHWKDTDGHKFVSAGSNENTCLLFDPGFQTAGTLVHSNGEYFLHQTTCSQRRSCAASCRCTDCPRQVATKEDIDTDSLMGDIAKGAADMAKKGAVFAKEKASAAYASAKKKAQEHLAAAAAAKEEYQKKHSELAAGNTSHHEEHTNLARLQQELERIKQGAQQDLDRLNSLNLDELQNAADKTEIEETKTLLL